MGKFSKNLSSALDVEFSKAIGNAPSGSAGDILTQHSQYKKELPETTKKFKKSEIVDLIGKKKMNLPIGKLYSVGKSETKEATGSGAAGGSSISQPIMFKKEFTEKWSKTYKDSIDCNNPKGFSQKAHCQGKKQQNESEFKAPKLTMFSDEAPKQKVKPKIYKTETKEATSSSASGSYETPKAWAKSLSKKDWRGKSKTQIPGGKFVQVKKKCKKFPYCNQGDINALKLTNEETLNKIITNLSKEYNLSENTIKNMILKEYTIKNK